MVLNYITGSRTVLQLLFIQTGHGYCLFLVQRAFVIMACEYGHEGLKVRPCHSYQCGNRGGGGEGGVYV